MQLFAAWESFYVMIGSSAAALIGLQFVVITLLPQVAPESGVREIDAFATPTVVFFAMALFISAVLCAPWRAVAGPAILLELEGAAGLVYSFVVARRSRRVPGYSLVPEDWFFFVVLPGLANLAVITSAALLRTHLESAQFAIGASALLLLFLGIHNAWDIVTFIVGVLRHQKPPGANQK